MMLTLVFLLTLIFLALVSHPAIARNLPDVLGRVVGLAVIRACLSLLIAGGTIFAVLYPDAGNYITMRIVQPILVWVGPALLVVYAVVAIWERRGHGPMTQLTEMEKATRRVAPRVARSGAPALTTRRSNPIRSAVC